MFVYYSEVHVLKLLFLIKLFIQIFLNLFKLKNCILCLTDHLLKNDIYKHFWFIHKNLWNSNVYDVQLLLWFFLNVQLAKLILFNYKLFVYQKSHYLLYNHSPKYDLFLLFFLSLYFLFLFVLEFLVLL